MVVDVVIRGGGQNTPSALNAIKTGISSCGIVHWRTFMLFIMLYEVTDCKSWMETGL